MFERLRERLADRLDPDHGYSAEAWAVVEPVLAQTLRLGEPPRAYQRYTRGPQGPLAYVVEWGGSGLSNLCEIDAAGRVWRADLMTEAEGEQFVFQKLRRETDRDGVMVLTTAWSMRPPRLAEQPQLRARLDAIEPRMKPWHYASIVELLLKGSGQQRSLIRHQYELLLEELAGHGTVDQLTMEMAPTTRREWGLPRHPPQSMDRSG